MQFNATFNNISVTSWQSVLIVPGVPRKNSCSIQTHYHDSAPTSVCSRLHVITACSAEKQQIPILQFDPTGGRAHNLPHNHVKHYATDAANQQFDIFPFFMSIYIHFVPTNVPSLPYRERVSQTCQK